MKKILLLALPLFLFLTISNTALAHPGRTASDGCHYCRTNCDSWGVAWNERHCHNGSSVAGESDSSTQQTAPIAPAVQETQIEQPIVIPTVIKRIVTKKPVITPVPYIETELDKQKLFKVARIVDGDTIKVNIRGKIESIRLLAIDTPETVDPRKPVQCFGKEATNKMKSFVTGKYVKLTDDKTQGNRDKYNRLLRYVYLDNGTFVNAEMVKQGYASSYKQYPTKYLNDFNNLEKQARENNLGLWSSCK